MTADMRQDTVVPLNLLQEIRAAADEEGRPAADLVREALERYMAERQWTRLFTYGDAQSAALGLTEEDLPRLIAESRAEGRRHPA